MARWMFGLGAVCMLALAPTRAADAAPDLDDQVRSILKNETLHLGDLFRIAELNSPRLASARSEVAARAGQARQAGLYPNPELEYEAEDIATDDFGLRKDKIALAVPLVFSGRLGNAADQARAQRNAAGHMAAETRRTEYRRIHALWAEALYLREARMALDDLLETGGRTVTIAETRFQAQAAPESQVSKAQLEAAELEMLEVTLAERRRSVRTALAAALGLDDIPLDRLAGSLEPAAALPASGPDSLTAHPAVGAARAQVEAARAAESLAGSQRWPDLRVFAAYGMPRPSGDNFLEAGISLPFPLFDRNQGRVAETRARASQAQSRLLAVEHDLRARWAEAQAARATLHQKWSISRDRLLPAAERTLEQARAGYRVGRVPFLELLDAQRTYSRIRLNTLELKRDLILAEADLLALSGGGLYAHTGEQP